MLRALALTLVIAAALAPPGARARELGPFRARAELGGALGVAEAGLGGLAVRASAAWRPLVLEGSLDVCGYLGGGPRSFDLALLGGAGASFPASARWRWAALLVGGLHVLGTDEPGGIGYHDHAFPAAGLRVGLTREPARPRLFFPSLTVAATLLADLEREHDVFLAKQVGGYTALVSVTVGLGLAP